MALSQDACAFCIWLALAGCLVAGMYYWDPAVQSVLPPTWGDEIHFLIPAAPWSSGRTLDAGAMLNPNGVFWLPAGYYMFNASLFELAGVVSVRFARLGSFAALLLSALLLASLHRIVLPVTWRSCATFAACWLIGPSVLLAGNIVRPEALVLALTLGGVTAACRGLSLASASLAALAVCVHPLLALPALCASWCACWMPRRPWWRWRDLPLLTCALALLVFEGWRSFSHWSAFSTHMGFQLARKSAREQGVLTLLAAVAFASCLLRAAWKGRHLGRPREELVGERVTVTLAGSAAAALLVASYGQEMWYASFRHTGVCCLLLAASAWTLPKAERLRRGRMLVRRLVLVVPTAAALLFSSLAWGVAVMRGKVQGLPVRPSVLREAAQDRREMESWVLSRTHAAAGEQMVLSPFVAGPLLGALQEGRMYVLNPFSDLRRAHISRVLYVEHGYPGNLDERSVIAALRGSTCLEAERFQSTHGWYRLTLARVAPLAGDEQQVFHACVPPAGYPEPTSLGVAAQ